MDLLHRRKLGTRGVIPFVSRRAMRWRLDRRLPPKATGLAVFEGRRARFYPLTQLPADGEIVDTWRGRPLRVMRAADAAGRAGVAEAATHPLVWVRVYISDGRHLRADGRGA